MNWPGDDDPCFLDERLHAIERAPPSPSVDTVVQTSREIGTGRSRGDARARDPGLAAVLNVLAPSIANLADSHSSMSTDTTPTSEHMEATADEPADSVKASLDSQADEDALPKVERHDSGNTALEDTAQLSPRRLAATATAVIASSEEGQSESGAGAESGIAHPAHATGEALSLRPASRATARSPLKVQTETSHPATSADPNATTSSLASREAASIDHRLTNTLPAVSAASAPDSVEHSVPRKERLPSFSQFTGQLNELAEAAAREPPQPYTHHHHSQSFSSTTSQSPALPYHVPAHPFPPSAQTSPIGHYAQIAKSPTSAVSDLHQTGYGSPQQWPGSAAYFAHRSSSATAEGAMHAYPPSLPSAGTSSGESQGHPGSSTDGYSTNHTTPIDPTITADGTPRPILPPPPGMPHSAILMTGYKCDYNGCNAPPFQTQYLLTYVRPLATLFPIR